jgi:hypothetical protein
MSCLSNADVIALTVDAVQLRCLQSYVNLDCPKKDGNFLRQEAERLEAVSGQNRADATEDRQTRGREATGSGLFAKRSGSLRRTGRPTNLLVAVLAESDREKIEFIT